MKTPKGVQLKSIILASNSEKSGVNSYLAIQLNYQPAAFCESYKSQVCKVVHWKTRGSVRCIVSYPGAWDIDLMKCYDFTRFYYYHCVEGMYYTLKKNNIKCKEKGKDNLRDTLRSLKWAIRALLITWMSLQGQR